MKVFIYGSERTHGIMDGCKYIGAGSLGLDYSLYIDQKVPKLIKAASPFNVEGELWEVPYERLKKIDLYNGHPIFYERENAEIFLQLGETLEAFVYIFQGGVSKHAIKAKSFNL